MSDCLSRSQRRNAIINGRYCLRECRSAISAVKRGLLAGNYALIKRALAQDREDRRERATPINRKVEK